MTTKERIEEESLNLFSVKGYSGVSIRDIARVVGIKESSIYKHYKGKEDIYNTIVQHYKEKTELIFTLPVKEAADFADISKEMLIAMVKITFQTFAMDDYISKCRKLFMISAPGDANAGSLYIKSFVTEPIAFNTLVFQKLLTGLKPQSKEPDKKTMEDARAMAYQFYSPVFLILQEYDCKAMRMEEALTTVEKVTGMFMEVHGL